MTAEQLSLRFNDPRGGRRAGAGRKPKNGKAGVSHRARPVFAKPTPVHVTLRIRDDVPSLRASRRFAAIRRSFAAARGRNGMRLVEFSVLSNHLHLVVEAESSLRLSRGVQGLAIRLAKALNAVLKGRKGGIFADHFHSRLLRTPTELTRALRYVADNARHHYGDADAGFSSRAPENRGLLAAPIGWLLRVGWSRAPAAIRIAPAALIGAAPP